MDVEQEARLRTYAKRMGLYSTVPNLWDSATTAQRRHALECILRPSGQRHPSVALPRFKVIADTFVLYPTQEQVSEWSERNFATLPTVLWLLLTLAYDQRTRRFSFLSAFCSMKRAGYTPEIWRPSPESIAA